MNVCDSAVTDFPQEGFDEEQGLACNVKNITEDGTEGSDPVADSSPEVVLGGTGSVLGSAGRIDLLLLLSWLSAIGVLRRYRCSP